MKRLIAFVVLCVALVSVSGCGLPQDCACGADKAAAKAKCACKKCECCKDCPGKK